MGNLQVRFCEGHCVSSRLYLINKQKGNRNVYSTHDMYVDIEHKGDSLAVPLYQLEAVSADDKTRQALKDWHYWVDNGYSF